jgi:uncharacterized protein (TIGR02246 family)
MGSFTRPEFWHLYEPRRPATGTQRDLSPLTKSTIAVFDRGSKLCLVTGGQTLTSSNTGFKRLTWISIVRKLERAIMLSRTQIARGNAFQRGDAKAVGAFWAEDGEYVDYNAHRFEGRVAIENAFKTFFAENKDLKLRIEINSLRFVTPDVAIEDGTTSVISPDGWTS